MLEIDKKNVKTEIASIENTIPNKNILSGVEVFNNLAESEIVISYKHRKQLVQFSCSIANSERKLPLTIRKQAVNFIMWMTTSKPKTVVKQGVLNFGIGLIFENANMTNEELEELQNTQLTSNKKEKKVVLNWKNNLVNDKNE